MSTNTSTDIVEAKIDRIIDECLSRLDLPEKKLEARRIRWKEHLNDLRGQHSASKYGADDDLEATVRHSEGGSSFHHRSGRPPPVVWRCSP